MCRHAKVNDCNFVKERRDKKDFVQSNWAVTTTTKHRKYKWNENVLKGTHSLPCHRRKRVTEQAAWDLTQHWLPTSTWVSNPTTNLLLQYKILPLNWATYLGYPKTASFQPSKGYVLTSVLRRNVLTPKSLTCRRRQANLNLQYLWHLQFRLTRRHSWASFFRSDKGLTLKTSDHKLSIRWLIYIIAELIW